MDTATDTRIATLEAYVEMQTQRIEALEAALAAKPARKERDTGPKSTRRMTRRLAIAVALRLQRRDAVKDIADRYGLSRGQVYSLRGGYTYTDVLEQVGLEAVRK